ncbi:class I adenylate-forming enzyme family protein [Novosphingobium sp. Gsoil 351]|uniref:class I adenylate-forming enzyme family protein n=1 Tax=Novosphingobium sp. Gsoil 351 TaxID=2675225 RepID=UPI0012B4A787|nr:AMP-binding protein [Novosphingobium sp. Gsoil 351]QGN55890.1 AMP-binding protein [Novosphingobium sp. Gsoil 351]
MRSRSSPSCRDDWQCGLAVAHVPRALRAAAGREPGKVAMVQGKKTRAFGALAERVEALRNAAITALGVRKGDNVGIIARNCFEFIEVVAALPDAGAAVAMVNPRGAPPEMAATLEDCGATLVFADAQSAAFARTTGRQVIVFGEEYEVLLANAAAPPNLPQIDEWDAWTIPYTSGTTGKPKGVVLSHRSRMLVAMICASEFGGFGPDDRFLAMSPMNHGGGLGFPVSILSLGGSIEILDKFDPEATLERLKFGGITGLFMVPTHFQMIFALPPATLARYARPETLKSILANAAPLPQALKPRILEYFGETVLNELYAATETGLVCNLRPRDQLRKASCVGTPFAHVEVEVRREDGSICHADEVGELWSRGPVMFNGYWNRPEETARAINDGWVSVGDMARRDAEGFLYIVDRLKDLVISGGVNIYPREIEEVLFTHPAIADVAVVGVPDETWGERLKIFAVLREPLTAEDVGVFCTGKIAPYKIPKELEEMSELPRNANGKVLKTALRARAA